MVKISEFIKEKEEQIKGYQQIMDAVGDIEVRTDYHTFYSDKFIPLLDTIEIRKMSCIYYVAHFFCNKFSILLRPYNIDSIIIAEDEDNGAVIEDTIWETRLINANFPQHVIDNIKERLKLILR